MGRSIYAARYSWTSTNVPPMAEGAWKANKFGMAGRFLESPDAISGETSMEPVRANLRYLEELMPEMDKGTYEFGRLLADRINPTYVPPGFFFSANLLWGELQEGVDGISGERIQSSLVGQPAMYYALMAFCIPNIADAVLPSDFAAEAKEFTETKRSGRSRRMASFN